MAKQEDQNKGKEVTTAPGADSSSDEKLNQEANDQGSNDNPETSDVPAWVTELKASNQSVLESNQAVLDAIAAFNENASTVVGDIMKEANNVGSVEKEATGKEAPEVKLKKKAKYVVGTRKKFFDSSTKSIIGEGSDVSDLSAVKLKKLLSLGIIEEA